MSRIAYVNGSYVPHPAARVHIEDRGFQFADGVYEVCGVLDGRLLDERPHLDRLERSLGELRIAMPMGRRALRLVMRELIHRNRIRDGLLYIQVTRGVAPRDHKFPAATTRPTVVMTARRQARRPLDRIAEEGVRVVTMPDIRWRRCDIKSVSLLPNVLAKQAAREAGAFEAWLVDDEGFVTEGSSTNAWILDAAGRLITRHLDQRILHGITRRLVMEVAADLGIAVEQRAFTVEEAKQAREAFLTAATAFVTPVIEIDGAVIANGAPGSIALSLRKAYAEASIAKAESLSGQIT